MRVTTGQNAPIYRPPAGPIQGWVDQSVRRATGIPYATAERFRAPHAVPDWTEAYAATTWSPACPQNRSQLIDYMCGDPGLADLGHARIYIMLDDPLRPLVSAYADAFELLAAATTGRTRKGSDGVVLAISGAPVAEFNAIISPSREPDPDEIASLANSETWDCPWSIQVRGAPGPLVTEVAARHGLTEVIRQPLMVRRPELGMPAEPTIDSLRVRAISEDELRTYTAAVADGFEVPRQAFEVFTNPAVARINGVTFYFAELDGIPVGTGMTAISGDITGIFQIATLPQYRRRGYGRAVTTEMVRAGFAAGAATAYLYASEMGESIYISTGFRTEEYLTVIAAPS